MADYGPNTEHAYEVDGNEVFEDPSGLLCADEEAPAPTIVIGDPDGATSSTTDPLDLTALACDIVKAWSLDYWTPTDRMPNEWESTGGARLRIGYSIGETCASFLPKGWRAMATWERAVATHRFRIRGEKDFAEFDLLVRMFGRFGSIPGTPGAGVAVQANVSGPAPVIVEAGQMPLPIAPATVVLDQAGIADSGMLPTRTHPTDAGLDLYTVGDWAVPPGEWRDIPCGIAVELPDHVWGMIIGRSSTLRKKSLMVQISVIDPGYRGLLFVQVWNLGTSIARVRDKERIGQLVVMPNLGPTFTPVWVKELGESARGVDGFGSSGA